MARYKTVDEIKNMCEEASKDMSSFYKADCINYRGTTKEKEPYTELIAKWLLDNPDKLEQISEKKRSGSYNTNHKGEMGEKTSRVEEYIAKQLFNSKAHFQGLGKIIDYQTPLKSPGGGSSNEGLGKIDLLSRNDETKCAYILEHCCPLKIAKCSLK